MSRRGTRSIRVRRGRRASLAGNQLRVSGKGGRSRVVPAAPASLFRYFGLLLQGRVGLPLLFCDWPGAGPVGFGHGGCEALGGGGGGGGGGGALPFPFGLAFPNTIPCPSPCCAKACPNGTETTASAAAANIYPCFTSLPPFDGGELVHSRFYTSPSL